MGLRVLFNTYPVAFHCPGGGEVQLLKYRDALADLGVSVLLYNPWDPQFDDVDIVHYFSVQGGSWRFCMHVRQIGLPLAISPILWITPERLRHPIDEIHTLLHNCDVILPNSIAEAKQQADVFGVPAGRFKPIVNGVDDVFLTPAAPTHFRKVYGIEGPFVLCVGNIESRKNQLGLIRAMKGLNLPLVLIGSIREPEYGELCFREGGGMVQWLGQLEYGSEMQRSAYAACSTFALPSTMETPGLAALEAAACGAAVVITQEGCTKEYFADHAHYVDPLDTSSIRQGVLSALAVSDSPDTRIQRRHFIAERYTWNHAADQLVAAYSGVFEQLGRCPK